MVIIKISLAEVRLRLEDKEKELTTLLERRRQSLYNIYKKEGKEKELLHEEHEFSIKDLTEDINRVNKEIRKLRLSSTMANTATLTEFEVDGEAITLQEAIYLIKQFREELPTITRMGDAKTRSQIIDPSPRFGQGSVDRSYEELTVPTYNTKDYRKKAEKLEKEIRKLELAINKANLTTEVEVGFLTE